MINRRIPALLLSCLCGLLLAKPALAGGWAVVTLDELPYQVRAGEPTTLGFMVRQHGQHPINLENVVLIAKPQQGGDPLTFTAAQTGGKGHYVVEVLWPTPGVWQWEIRPGGFPPVSLAPITVNDAAVAEPNHVASMLPWLLTGSGVLVLGGAALIAHPIGRHRRAAASVLGLSLVLGGLGWVGDLGARLPSAVAAPSTAERVAYGQALFMAKGCNTCHLHDGARNAWSTESGADLTHYQNTADYLRVWLKDPQALKPTTAMPNLALKQAEIEALAAFLTQKAQ